MNEEAILLLYNDLKDTYDIGSIDDFKNYLMDDNKKQMFFEQVIKPKYDVNTIEDFESVYGLSQKKKEDSTVAATDAKLVLDTEQDFLDTQTTPVDKKEEEYQPQDILEPIDSENAEFEASLKTSVTPENIGTITTPYRDINKILEKIGVNKEGSGNDTEEYIVPEMQYKFGKYGFDFEKANPLGDAMRVKARGTNKELYVKLDRLWGQKGTAKELEKFLRDNKRSEDEILKQSQAIVKNKRIVQTEEELKSAVKLLNQQSERFVYEDKEYGKAKAELDSIYESNFSNISKEQLKNNPVLREDYKAWLESSQNLEINRKQLENQYTDFKYRGAKLDNIAGEYTAMKAKQGTWWSGFWNEIAGNAGATFANINLDVDLSTYLDEKITMSGAFGDVYKPRREKYKKDIIKIAKGKGLAPKELNEDMTLDQVVESLGGNTNDILSFFRMLYLDPQIEKLGIEDKLKKEETNFDIVQGTLLDIERKNLKYYEPRIDPSDPEGKRLISARDRAFSDALSDDPKFRNPFSVAGAKENNFGNEGMVAAGRKAFNFLKDKSTTEQWAEVQKQGNFMKKGFLGLGGSLPAMFGTSSPIGWAQRTAQMYNMATDHVDQEMEKNPMFDKISETEKTKVKMPIGIATAVLENIGLRNIISQKGLLNSLVYKALGKSNKSTTAKTFQEFIRQDIESMIGRGSLVVVGAGLAEFETGFAQEMASIKVKDVYNASKEAEMFDTPKTFAAYMSQVVEAGMAEAVGGFIMGSIPATTTAISGLDVQNLDPKTFEIFEKTIQDPTLKSTYIAGLKNRIANPKDLTDHRAAQKELDLVNKLEGIMLANRVPFDSFNTNQRKEALQLLLQKETLENEIKTADKVLSEPKQDLLDRVNKRLNELTGESIATQEEAEAEAEGIKPFGIQEEASTEIVVEDPSKGYSFEYESEQEVPSQLESIEPISKSEIEVDGKKKIRLTFSGQQLIDAGLGKLKTETTPEVETEAEVDDEVVYEMNKTNKKTWSKDFEIMDNRNGLELGPVEENGKWAVRNKVTGEIVNANTKKDAQNIIANAPAYAEMFGDGTKVGSDMIVTPAPAPKVEVKVEPEAAPEVKAEEEIDQDEQTDIEEFFKDEIDENVQPVSPNLSINKKGKQPSKQNKNKVKIIKIAKASARSIAKLLPKTKIVLHESQEEFLKYAPKGRGYYDTTTDTIHVNLSIAQVSTVPHEVFHAVLLNKLKTDPRARAMAIKMVESVKKTLPKSSELYKEIDAFSKLYTGDQEQFQEEEFIAQLIGLMSSQEFKSYKQLKAPAKYAIVEFFKKIAKKFGIKLGQDFGKDDQSVIDFINVLATKTVTGEEITEQDVEILQVEEQGGSGQIGTFNNQGRQAKAPNISEDTRGFAKYTIQKDLSIYEGKNFLTNMYDFTNAGPTNIGGGIVLDLHGGKNYVADIMEKTGAKLGEITNVAAFNTKENAEGFIKNAIEGNANLFAPHAGTKEGSWQFQQNIFEQLVEKLLDNNVITNEELIKSFNSGLTSKDGKKGLRIFNKAYSKAQDEKGSNLPKLKNTNNLNDFIENPKKLVELLDIDNNYSPDLRKVLNDKIASNKKVQEFLGIKNKTQFAELLEDPMNVGSKPFDLMGVIEFDNTTFEDPSRPEKTDADYHPSFAWTVKAKIKAIVQPTYFYQSTDVTDSYTKFNKDGVVVSRKTDVKDSKGKSLEKLYKIALKDTRKYKTNKQGKKVIASGKAPFNGTFEDFQKSKFKSSNVSSSAGSIPKIATVKKGIKQNTPQSRKQIIGENAELSQNVRDNLSVAKQMEDVKESVEDIRIATGWERGADGKWRYEIDDGDFNLSGFTSLKQVDYNRLVHRGIAPKNRLIQRVLERTKVVTKRNKQEWLKFIDNEGNGQFKNLSNKEVEGAKIFVDNLIIGEKFKNEGFYTKEDKGTLELKTKLGDILTGGAIDRYPQLKNVDVKIIVQSYSTKNKETGFFGIKGESFGGLITATTSAASKTPQGYFNTGTDSSYLNRMTLLESVLLHEIQHEIQNIEGFALGGNTQMFEGELDTLKFGNVNALYSFAKDIAEANPEKGWDITYSSDAVKKYEQIFNKKPTPTTVTLASLLEQELSKGKSLEETDVYKTLKNNNLDSFEKYQRLAGEVEARNVQDRRGMTPEQRRKTTLQETTEIAVEDQIFITDAPQSRKQQDAPQSRKQKRDVISKKEAAKTIKHLSKKYGIEGALKDMGIFSSYGEFDRKYLEIKINSETAFDAEGNLTSSIKGTGNISRQTIFHEYLHPFVEILENSNKKLYNEIYNKALEQNKKENFFTNQDAYSENQQKEELVVRYLDRLSKNDKVPTLLQSFLDFISETLFKKKKNNRATLEKLSTETSVEELYDIFKNYGNLKEDIAPIISRDNLKKDIKFAEELLKVAKQENLPQENIDTYQKDLDILNGVLEDAPQSRKQQDAPQSSFKILNKEFTTEDSLFPTSANKKLAAEMRALYDSGVSIELSIAKVDSENIALGSPIQDADVDMVSFGLSVNGNNIGSLVVNSKTNEIVNVEILSEFRGLSLGTKLYKAAAVELGGLISDSSFLSNEAENIWKSLVKQKLAVKTNVKAKGANAGYAMIEDTPQSRQQRTTRLAPNGKQSNLTDVQYDAVRTPVFKKWFGDWETDPKNASKVVDENGEPLVVYHGSPSLGIDEFDRTKTERVSSGLKEFGTYFSTNTNLATLYSKINETVTYGGIDYSTGETKKGRVYPVFLNLRKIKTFDGNGEANIEAWRNLKADAGYKIAQNRDAMEVYAGLNSMVGDKLKVDGIEAKNIIEMSVGTSDKNSQAYIDAKEEYLGDAYLVFDGQPQNIKLADGSNTTFDINKPSVRQQKTKIPVAIPADLDQQIDELKVRIEAESVLEDEKDNAGKVAYTKKFFDNLRGLKDELKTLELLKEGLVPAYPERVALVDELNDLNKPFMKEVGNKFYPRKGTVKKGKKIKEDKDLGGIFEVDVDGYLFRGVSLADFSRIIRTGFIDTDLRGAISEKEGINLAPNASTAFNYLPEGVEGVVMAIKVDKDMDLFMIGADDYVRSSKPIPYQNVKVITSPNIEGRYLQIKDNAILRLRSFNVNKDVQVKPKKEKTIYDIAENYYYDKGFFNSNSDLIYLKREVEAVPGNYSVKMASNNRLYLTKNGSIFKNLSKPKGRLQKSTQELINEGRQNNFTEDNIRDFLVRVLKKSAKEVDKLMSLDKEFLEVVPKSFANIKGGIQEGIKLYKKIEAYRKKLIEKNNKEPDGRNKTIIDSEIKGVKARIKAVKNNIKFYKDELKKLKKELLKSKKKKSAKEISNLLDSNSYTLDLKKAEIELSFLQNELTVLKEEKPVTKNLKLTSTQIVDKTIEYLQLQPEYINEGDKYTVGSEKKGTKKTLTRTGFSTQQARMLADYTKTAGVRPTNNMGAKIRKAKAAVRERVKGGRDLQKQKTALRNFIRQSLPPVLYTKKRVIDLVNTINDVNQGNIENLMKEVIDFVNETNVKSLQEKIKSIIDNKYFKVESGRKKPIKISDEIAKRIKFIKSNMLSSKSTLEEISEANLILLERFDALASSVNQTNEIKSEMVDITLAMQYNNSLLLENKNENKVIQLNEMLSNLEEMIEFGRSELRDQILQKHLYYLNQFEMGYESITGKKMDMSDPESFDELNKMIKTYKNEVKKRASQNVIKKFFTSLKDGVDRNIFGSAEDMFSLMDRLDKLPGEMYGGNLQEMFTDRVDGSNRLFKGRMMLVEQLIQAHLEEIYGKKWKDSSRKNRVDKDLGIMIQDGVPLSPMSQNQIGYLYNMYKDPANRKAFADPKMYGIKTIPKDATKAEKEAIEELNKQNAARVMTEIIAQLDSKVKETADWQVNELYPFLYNHYNDAYKKLYRTDLPWNEFYAGTIYREGMDEENASMLDMLNPRNMYSTAVGGAGTKMRQNSSKPIKEMDMMDVLNTYLNQMEYFAAFGEVVNDMNKFFNNKYVADAIKSIHGNSVYNFTLAMVDKIASRGSSSSMGNKLINGFNNVFILSRLALSPVIMIKQLTSFITYMNDIGPANYLKYAAKNKLEMMSVYKEIRDNSVYMKDRQRQSIMRAIETYSDSNMKQFVPSGTKDWIVNFAMWTTKFGDKAAIYIGGMPNYSYYKAQFKKENPQATEQEAIDYAIIKFERDTKRTQQSGDLQDKDYTQTKDPIYRGLNMFLTTPKQYLRKEIVAIRNLNRKLMQMDSKAGKGTIAQNLRTFVMYHVVMPVFFQYVSMGLPGILRDPREDDDEDLLRAAIIGNLNALFIIGELFNVAGDLFTNKIWTGNTFKSVGVLSIAGSLSKKFLYANNLKDAGKKEEAYKKAYLELATLTGVPAPTIARYVENYGNIGKDGDIGKDILRLLNFSKYQIEGPGKPGRPSSPPTIQELNEEYDRKKRKEQRSSSGSGSVFGSSGRSNSNKVF